MNRIDRLHAILIHLQSKHIVKAQELADRFEISLRTVYRDIRSLEESGVPIGAEAGVGYFLTDNYHLPPVMFTNEEASALLFGSKLIDKMSDKPTRHAYESALFKIKSVLRNDEKEHLEQLHEHISVYNYNMHNSENETLYITEIQKALVHKNILRIHYHAKSKNEKTERNIEPIGLCYYGNHWHLIAYCLKRNDYRDFRLNRIISLVKDVKSFKEKKHKTLDVFFSDINEYENLYKIKLTINNEYKRIIDESKYWYGYAFERRVNEKIEMTFYNGELQGFAQWVMNMGSNAEVLKPTALRNIIIESLKNLSNIYF